MKKIEKLKFDEDRVFRELSERLYPTYLDAFRELIIQNTFDADATQVEAHISNDEITIKDNGHGMDRELIKEFLTIGSDVKSVKGKTPNGRPLIGMKGIGRLSWAQLGDEAVVYTQTDNGEGRKIVLKKGSRDVVVSEVKSKWECPGTEWNIKKLMRKISFTEVYEYLCECGGLLPLFFKDFKVKINNRLLKERIPEGERFAIEVETPFGKADGFGILTKGVAPITICSNYIKVAQRMFGGVGGYINADFLDLTSDRNNFIKNEKYSELIKAINRKLKSVVTKLSKDEKIVKDYTNVLKNFSKVNKIKKIAEKIPVSVFGIGEKKIGDLEGKIVYTSVYTESVDPIADAGYSVVLANNPATPFLLKMVHKKILPISAIKVEKSQAVSESGKKLRLVLDSAGTIVRQSFRIINPKKIEENLNIKLGDRAISMVTPKKKESGKEKVKKKKKAQKSSRPSTFRLKKDYIKAKGIEISFVEYKEKGKPIFSSSDQIYLNVQNDYVERIFDAPDDLVPLLLIDPVAHELTHILLDSRVHNETFVKFYDYLRYNLFMSNIKRLTKYR